MKEIEMSIKKQGFLSIHLENLLKKNKSERREEKKEKTT
jgi:hypothetical protein